MMDFGIPIVSLRGVQVRLAGLRWKSFKVKQKWATTRRKQDAPSLALEHFDFHYKPVFGEHWPSIRLGLLSDPKYCAMVNNYAANADGVHARLRSLGTMDLMDHAGTFGQKVPTGVGMPDAAAEDADGGERDVDAQVDDHHPESDLRLNVFGESVDDLSSIDLRGRAGLYTFVKPKAASSDSKVEATKLAEKAHHYDHILQDGLRPSTQFFSGQPFSVLPDDRIPIPSKLRAMMFNPGDISVFEQSPANKAGVVGYYLMDAASLFPVICLGLVDEDSVLDLCAAPGGKSLAILQTMKPGVLLCNDNDITRMARLQKTLEQFVPLGAPIRGRIVLKRADATQTTWGSPDMLFDKVLVDAPCSSDRISVTRDSDDGRNIFRRSRAVQRAELPERQIKLLMTGLRSLKPGGTLVYSTCSMSQAQNDSVVEMALHRWNLPLVDPDTRDPRVLEDFARDSRRAKVNVRRVGATASIFQDAEIFRFSQDCKYGQLIVPYLMNNFGPLYVARLEKSESLIVEE